MATSGFSEEDGVFYGQLLGLKDMVYFQAESAENLETEFHNAVDDYLEFCGEIGKEPESAEGLETSE